MLSSLTCVSQILDRDMDIDEMDFSVKNFTDLDPELAIKFLERKTNTLISNAAAQSAAAAPLGQGTIGVALAQAQTNLRMDELITLNQNYNYKMTGVLGNILKVVKETRDGSITYRLKKAAQKVEIVDETLRAVRKCQKTKDALNRLQSNGWTTRNMLNAVRCIDGALSSLEIIGKEIRSNFNSSDEQERNLKEARDKLKQIQNELEETYQSALREQQDLILAKYRYEYTSALITGAFYGSDLTETQAEEKIRYGLSNSKETVTAFRNVMWGIVILFFLVAATASVWKVFFMGDDSIAIIKYFKAWIVGLAVTTILSGMLEQFLPIIYS